MSSISESCTVHFTHTNFYCTSFSVASEEAKSPLSTRKRKWGQRISERFSLLEHRHNCWSYNGLLGKVTLIHTILKCSPHKKTLDELHTCLLHNNSTYTVALYIQKERPQSNAARNAVDFSCLWMENMCAPEYSWFHRFWAWRKLSRIATINQFKKNVFGSKIEV